MLSCKTFWQGKKKGPDDSGPDLRLGYLLHRLNFRCLRSFRTLANFIFDLLPVIERPETLGEDAGLMHEKIISPFVRGYEAETFC